MARKKMQEDHRKAIIRKKRIDRLWIEAAWGIGAIFLSGMIGIMFALVVQDRIEKYPHLGTEWIPKTEAQRREEARPKVYVGR